MTTIYYVRHAEPNYGNHDDYARELTPKGLEDRKLVTEFLRKKMIAAAISSPYLRAIDTVKDYTDSVGLDIRIMDSLRERKIDSVWIEDFAAFSRKQWEDFSYKLSDGESLQEVQQRNIAALAELLQEFRGKAIVIGGHGTALSTILNYYDPSFGYDAFLRIKNKMPWIVEFQFDDSMQLMQMLEHDLL